MNKKPLIITAAVSTVAVFILTTIFYNTYLGRLVYSEISRRFGNSDFAKFIKMETIIDSNFMGEYNKRIMIDSAASAYAGSIGDPYTEYLNTEAYKSVNENLEGGYRGIGIQVSISSDIPTLVSRDTQL